jgi:hypothetical protein
MGKKKPVDRPLNLENIYKPRRTVVRTAPPSCVLCMDSPMGLPLQINVQATLVKVQGRATCIRHFCCLGVRGASPSMHVLQTHQKKLQAIPDIRESGLCCWNVELKFSLYSCAAARPSSRVVCIQATRTHKLKKTAGRKNNGPQDRHPSQMQWPCGVKKWTRRSMHT